MYHKSNSILLLVAIFTISGACGSKKIQGQVTDSFGAPLSGVTVRIEKTQFLATSESDGGFTLEYAPGEFVIQFSLEGYTTEGIELSVHEKSSVPLQPVVLYPVPREEGIFLLTEDGLRDLSATCEVSEERRRYREGWAYLTKYTYRLQAWGGPEHDFEPGELTFIDSQGGQAVLVEVTPDGEGNGGIIARYTGSSGFADQSKPELLTPVVEQREHVGREELLLRRVLVEPGVRYGWISMAPGLLGVAFPKPKTSCYYFTAGGEEQRASNEELLRVFQDSAAITQKIPRIEELLRKGVNLNAPSPRHTAGPFEASVRSGSSELVEYLLSKGMLANDPEGIECRAYYLTQGRVSVAEVEIFDLLMENGLDLSCLDSPIVFRINFGIGTEEWDADTALQMLKTMRERGVDLDAKNRQGESLLQSLMRSGAAAREKAGPVIQYLRENS